MMPLLGILLMSPHDVSMKYGRGIASEVEVAAPAPEARPASQTPKYDALLTSLTVPSRQNPVNLNGDLLKEEITSLLSRISTAEEFDKKTVLKPALDHLRDEIKASVIQLKQVENSLPDLINHDEEGDLKSRIAEARIRVEASLKDLDEDEVLLAARPAAAPAASAPATPAPEVAATPAPAATVRAPSVVAEETKPEVKPEVKPDPAKPEKDPILCALEEQNKLLQSTLQTFMQQQMTIMQQMMTMQQNMMMQNMYRTPDTFNYQNAYQYQQPQVAGNWVYYPNGMQPAQPGQAPGQMQNNIFGLNQQPQQPMGPVQPQMQPQYNPMNAMMYGLQQPAMMNQGGQWGLQPQAPLELMPPMNHQPGTFGLGSVGYNLNAPGNFSQTI